MMGRDGLRPAGRRRHPARREHAPAPSASRGRRRRSAAARPRPDPREPAPPLPRDAGPDSGPRRALDQARLGRPRRADGDPRRRGRRSASSPSRTYARLRDPAAAEVSFAVADEFQGRGIGTRLLEQLARRRSSLRDRAVRRARCCPRTAPCSASSWTPGSTSRGDSIKGASRSSSRSPRPRRTAPTSTSATTPRSSPRSGRSSSQKAWRCWARLRGPARSGAISSATSSRVASRAAPIRLTATASRSPASRATRRSSRSRSRSTSPSSACRASW